MLEKTTKFDLIMDVCTLNDEIEKILKSDEEISEVIMGLVDESGNIPSSKAHEAYALLVQSRNNMSIAYNSQLEVTKKLQQVILDLSEDYQMKDVVLNMMGIVNNG